MFGYVTANKPEMKIREYEYYRGVYCGLCRALGKCGGQCARLTLSYDFAFMALARMAIEGQSPKFQKRRCIAHPLKRRPMAMPDGTLIFCASASLLLAYGKIKDDVKDEKGGKRLAALAASPFASIMKRKSSKKFAALEKTIENSLECLSQYEKSAHEPSVDRPAEIFGELLSEIFSHGLEGTESKLAKKIGFHVGKWIYLTDAIDDYAEDVKKKRFNPLIAVYGEGGLGVGAAESLERALTMELVEAEKAFDLIDYPDPDIKEIICNIIYLGMPQRAKAVLKNAGRKEDK